MIRRLLLMVILILYFIFLGICVFPVSTKRDYTTHSPFYRGLLNGSTAAALFLLRIRITTEGLERVPTEKKPLFICNHRSNYDPIVTWHVLRHWRPAFISKKENFRIPIFGRLIRRCCFLPIDREQPRNAIKTIQKSAALLKADTVSIAVYPEGTRSKDCTLLPFHNGVFKIAQKAQVPIVVLTVEGTEQIHQNLPFRPSPVTLRVADVIHPEEAVFSDTKSISARARAAMERSLERSSTDGDR